MGYYRYIVRGCMQPGCFRDASVEIVYGSNVQALCMEHAEPLMDAIDQKTNR